MNSSYLRDEMFDQHLDSISNHKNQQTNILYDINPVIPTVKSKKKRVDGSSSLRKAPGAPKRFKSSYILFFMEKQKEIKAELGQGASVGEISKRSSEKWKNLSAEERAIWDDKAETDKERYNIEKEKYTGPWQVPWKRAKKNPNAPKRPMSAFLFFSQDKRRKIKEANPGMRNTEISRVLGGMWKKASAEERAPHIEREATQREKYKIEIAKWREEEALRCRKQANEEKEKWMDKASEEDSHSGIDYYRKSPPITERDSPLPLHQPNPSPPLPVQSYYTQSAHGDYYPVQNYAAPPQFNSYGTYQNHQHAHPQGQSYYRSYAPMPHSEYSSRQYQDYPTEYPSVAKTDSVDDSRHINHSISPAPMQYGTYYPPPSVYSVDPHHLTSNYSDDYRVNPNCSVDYPLAPKEKTNM